jgi:hypothetical protein
MPMGIGPGLSVTRGGSVTGIGAIGADLALWFDTNQAYKSSGGGIVTPDSILTYTAPSPKLVYGSDGVLKYAPHNLRAYSQDFSNADWVKDGIAVTADSIAAPDGTITADTLTKNVSGVNKTVSKSGIAVASGQPYTLSCYFQAGTLGFAGLTLISGAVDIRVYVNLATGAVTTVLGTPIAADATAAGGGWWRLRLTVATGGTSAAVYAYAGKNDGVETTTGTVYAWGAQLNLGSSALTYIPTTTAAVYSLPRDYNPTTGAALGVLVEEQRTNLLLRSQTFSNAYWDKVRGSITDNDVVAPDGTTTGAKFLETTDNNTHYVGVSGAGTTVSNGVAYTYSAYLKTLGRQWVSLNVFDTANRTTYFDIVNGVVGTTAAGTTASIQNVGNGWFRCIITLTVAATAVYGAVISASADGTNSFTGDITKGFYVWGAQLEAGAFATSYIPTVASQVTRAADQVSILTSAFPYSATAGTVALDFTTFAVGATRYVVDTGSNDGAFVYLVSSGSGIRMFDGTTGITSGSMVVGIPKKVAHAFDVGGLAGSADGAAVVTAAFDGGFGLGTSLSINRNGNYNGHIKRLDYYAVRKSNAELQVLST